ncbi:MAG: hypothetical protein K2L50_01820 [Bacteroidales bacterium]|nr:hypothetical protein [Bacteroidales bacterium]
MINNQLQRIGMLSGISVQGSSTPLQTTSIASDANDWKNISTPNTPTSPIEPDDETDLSGDGSNLKPTTSGFEEMLPGVGVTIEIPDTPTDEPVPDDDPAEPDPEEPEDGNEEYELVKEKKRPNNDKRHKLVRLVLVAVALLIAYRLFFSKRR